uniref:Uncharacterized protein n=1 Tax=Caenorhabditis japonica TaxID=281687 RepID=A0A8R1IJW5_CAEJA
MGAKSSKTAPEDLASDTYSTWGSDIDDTFCGPGKICADEWTPPPSSRSSPDVSLSHARRYSDLELKEDAITLRSEQVITEQPTWTPETIPVIDRLDLEERQAFKPKPMRSNKKVRRLHSRKPYHKRHVIIRTRRIRIIRGDPRYPPIPPPGHKFDVKFKKPRPEDVGGRAVPPRHLRGTLVSPKPFFRYRGAQKITV